MRGSAAVPAHLAKRRRHIVFLAVIVLSLFAALPLVLIHGHFSSGFFTDERSTMESGFSGSQQRDVLEDNMARITDLVRRFGPTFPKEVTEDDMGEADKGKKAIIEPIGDGPNVTSGLTNATSEPEGPPASPIVAVKAPPTPSVGDHGKAENEKHANVSTGDGSEEFCQLEHGSYCLWSMENKEVLRDSILKTVKDQLFVARAYWPSIAKLRGQERLSRELRQLIQEYEHMFGEAVSDADLPRYLSRRARESKIKRMDQLITKAKAVAQDFGNIEKKLRQLIDLTEDEVHFHMGQSAFLFHVDAQTMPKSLHCLSMRLTVEYFKTSPAELDQSLAHKLESPVFQNYVIFSRNLLAVSVTINSTVMKSEETGNMVFHVLTDGQNFYAMKFWFIRNSYKSAAVHVLNMEDLGLSSYYNLGGPHILSPSEEFRIFMSDRSPQFQMKTEYVSVFGHSHFLLPEIFKNLEKVVVLNDDVVVQRDLSPLWDLDLRGKVNGAVERCEVRFGQLKSYLGAISHDPDACAWMSGLNIIDLKKWREHNVTGIYLDLLHELQDGSEEGWRAATLPISYLAFQDLIYGLNDSWLSLASGLGHDYGVSEDTIENSVALHYNGDMKPWLDLGIPRYSKHWKRFLAQGERFLDDCNVNR